jgi:hypothetical protein
VKKKTILIILVGIFLFLVSLYFLNYFVFVEDEKTNFFTLNDQIEIQEESILQLNVSNFNIDNCTLTYCELNSCTESISLPCEVLSSNEFQGLGMYQVQLNFDSYLLYPWSDKQYLKNWSIKLLENQSKKFDYQRYLDSLKMLLSDRYIWEVYSIPLSRNEESLDNLFKQETINFDEEYIRDLYLINELAQISQDLELEDIFKREINYLNENLQTIVNQTSLNIPNPYISELVEEGLNEGYLTLNSNYSIPQYFPEVLNINAEYKYVHIADDNNPYNKDYQNIAKWSDLYRMFNSIDNKELAEYSKTQMFNIYTNTEYSVYGLCSVINSDTEILSFEELSNKLEPVFSNNQTELIEINLYELIMCKQALTKYGKEMGSLDDIILKLLNNSTLEIDGNLFIAQGISNDSNPEEGPNLIVNYNLLDNLVFLVNYYEE